MQSKGQYSEVGWIILWIALFIFGLIAISRLTPYLKG